MRFILPAGLFLLLMASFAFAEISGAITLGSRAEYSTASAPISLVFVRYDLFTHRATFLFNGEEVGLLPLQSHNVSGLSLTFLGTNPVSQSDFHALYTIDGFSPFSCQVDCISNFAVYAVQYFDREFRLCKEDCDAGCNLYQYPECLGEELWMVTNCGNRTQKVGSCDELCTGCGDCGSGGSCSASFCSAYCPPERFCVSDKDCGKEESCVTGVCTDLHYREGDRICSFQEPCSSPDCSCGTVQIEPQKDDSPIVLIHGFASSPARLRKLQRDLSFDLGYTNGGELNPYTLDCQSTDPRTVWVASYYSDEERIESRQRLASILQNLFLDRSGLKQEGESTFVSTFSDIVDKAKACADRDQVNVVAHSMGGLVGMGYVLEEDNVLNIHKMILLGAPNKGGIYGEQSYKLFKGVRAQLGDRKDLLRDCSSIGVPSLMLTLVDGRDIIGDCQELQRAGSLTNPLLNGDQTPGLVEYYTVSGKTDDKGDGMITLESATLHGAVRNSIVACDHFDLKDPVRCRDAYIEIIKDLGYTPEELKKETFRDRSRDFLLSIWDGVVILFE